MNGRKFTQTIIITAALGAAGSIASAQANGLSMFAMSISDELSVVDQNDSGFHFISADLGREFGSVVFLLDPPQSGQNMFQDMDRPGSDTPDQRGRSLQGVNGFHDYMPKEDELNVVPLPPAAFAGFGLLAGVAGVRYFRKAKR